MTSIGGQALIEGIMMRGPHKIATSVRKSDGEIDTKVTETNPMFTNKFVKLPRIRGSFAVIESTVTGIKECM